MASDAPEKEEKRLFLDAPENKIPPVCWHINGDHQFDAKWKSFSPLQNIRLLFPLAKNIFRIARRQAEITASNMVSGREKQAIIPSSSFRPINGVPLGGIGSGSIGRGFAGEFMCIKIIPGQRHQDILYGCMFIVTVRSRSKLICQYALTREPPQNSLLNLQSFVYIPLKLVDYYGLYPRSWTVYNLEGVVDLICLQCSPVIPNNYKDSSFPGSYFVWYVKNKYNDDVEVSLTFCWQSGLSKYVQMESYENFASKRCKGVIISENVGNCEIQFGIASKPVDSPTALTIRKHICLESLQHTTKLWQDLSTKGYLTSDDEESAGKGNCVAMCNQIILKPNEEKSVKFSLGWHMPVVKFAEADKSYQRYYTKFFKAEDTLKQILAYFLNNARNLNKKVFEWQMSIINQESSVLSTKTMWCILNELYYLTDGGTVWLRAESPEDHQHQLKWGKFLMLEGQDYLMYNTYDVFFYASAALIYLWPNIQLSIQYDFANLIAKEDTRIRKFLFSRRNQSKVAGRIPHDVGGPGGRPWTDLNAFDHADANNWKDLNLKFILTAFRDYSHTKDREYLEYMYKSIKPLITLIKEQDRNWDGLVDNKGSDQTYDAWKMFGCSAYCGGLQLAALQCMVWICRILNSNEESMYVRWLEKACISYEKALWNGEYYRFDSESEVLMAGQLAGYWSLKQCKLPLEGSLRIIWSEERVHSILTCLINRNRAMFMHGQSGIVNGMKRDKAHKWSIDSNSIQAGECWIGVTYALAAIMLTEGMQGEANNMLDNLIDQLWNRIGLGFQTPEAITHKHTFRGAGYMRALAIWSIPLLLTEGNEDSNDLEKVVTREIQQDHHHGDANDYHTF